MLSVDPGVNVDVSPMYAAQWTARLSFLSKALTFAPLDTSNWTICSDRETTHYTINTRFYLFKCSLEDLGTLSTWQQDGLKWLKIFIIWLRLESWSFFSLCARKIPHRSIIYQLLGHVSASGILDRPQSVGFVDIQSERRYEKHSKPVEQTRSDLASKGCFN